MEKIILCCAILVSLVSGNLSAGRYWYYHQVVGPQGQPISNGHSAIGMRSDYTWPVVASEGGLAAMLPGFWASASPDLFRGGRIDAATSSDGQVLFAGKNGQIATFGPDGWSTASYNGWTPFKASAAFNRDNSPAVLHGGMSGQQLTLTIKHGSTWYSSQVGNQQTGWIQAPSYALAFDSLNQANVVFSSGGQIRYAVNGSMTGQQWQIGEPLNLSHQMDNLGLVLTENDVPYLVYQDNQLLKYAFYNRVANIWNTGVIDVVAGGLPNFCVAADHAGGLGVAYYGQQGILSFASMNSSGAWMAPDRLTGAQGANPGIGLGLVFDGQNNPVISYGGGGGSVWIAYDPIIPEPATLGLFALGGLMVSRKRR